MRAEPRGRRIIGQAAGLLLAALLLATPPGSEALAAEPYYYVAIGLKGVSDQACAGMVWEIIVSVTWQSGRWDERSMDPNMVRYIPGVNITGTARLGSLPRSSAVTDTYGNAYLVYRAPDRPGREKIKVAAKGTDPATGKSFEVQNSYEFDVVKCTYQILITGSGTIPGTSFVELAQGAAEVEIKEGGSLEGEGTLTMSQTLGFRKRLGAICSVDTVAKDFPFKVLGAVSADTANFEITFEDTDAIPALSQKFECRTGAGSAILPMMPLWPVGPSYLKLDSFDTPLAGRQITRQPYPALISGGYLIIMVQLVGRK